MSASPRDTKAEATDSNGGVKATAASERPRQTEKVEQNREQKRPPALAVALKVAGFILDQWLIVGFGLAALLAHLFPCMCV
jgi:hypothetical protein